MKITGQSFGAERDTILKIIIIGSEDEIITDFEYHLESKVAGLDDLFKIFRLDILEMTAGEVLEELSPSIIRSGIEINEDEVYVVSLIEKTIRGALLDYVQHAKENYEREYTE
jgi:hypothetical protein